MVATSKPRKIARLVPGVLGMVASVTLPSIPIIILALILVSSAQAQQLLDYGTFSGYGLRKGILGNDYQNVLGACITGTESPLSASHANARVSIVYSADQYKRAFHIDQKAEATFLGIAGGGEDLHIGQETCSSGSAFDIIIETYAEHDGRTVDNVVWDSRHQAMIDSHDPIQILQARTDCGDRYIQSLGTIAVLETTGILGISLTTLSPQARTPPNNSLIRSCPPRYSRTVKRC
jgi:hypothetical protein